jgi:hypothetical protein
MDHDIYFYKAGNFIKQFSITDPNFGYQIYGRNQKDLFLRMQDGIEHYNGTNMQYIYEFPLGSKSIINEPAIFQDDVFFMLWDNIGSKNLVLHGKLKTTGGN